MLQGLINNNAVIQYILISKLIPAEKQAFTPSIRTGINLADFISSHLKIGIDIN